MAKETTEIGHGGLSTAPWSEFADSIETVPALIWPNNIVVYNEMRNDAQVAAVHLAQTLPIRRYKWMIDPNHARDEVVEFIARNLNLPIRGADPLPKGRLRKRFSHDKHLSQALLSLVYGAMYFEQVGRFENTDENGKLARGADPGKLLLRKLAPRMPLTIQEIKVARDGGLEYIRQHPGPREAGNGLTGGGMLPLQQPPIPVNRLMAYIHDQEGGDWLGRSMFRSAYKNWLVKDKLIRVDAVKHERNGVGVPIVEAPPNTNPKEMSVLAALAQQYRSGEASGGAIPNGARLRLLGVEGSTPDTIASVKYHDEQIAKNALAMFMSLGSTETGSRALGDSFTDFFSMSQEAIANEYLETTNAHLIEDLVDWNFGAEENAPLLVYERNEDVSASVVDLVALANAGFIEPDDDLRAFVRDRYKLPDAPTEQDPDEEVPTAPKLVPVAASAKAPKRERIVVKAAEEPEAEPAVGWRDPFEHEVAAGTDFTAIEAAYTAALAALLARWSLEVKPAMVADLVEQIEAIDPDDEVGLATVSASPAGQDVIEEAMRAFAASSVAAAMDEAAYQGVETEAPEAEDYTAELVATAAALAIIMARSLSEAANRHALSQVGAGLTSAEIASGVSTALDELTDTYPKDQFMGALSLAQNAGRMAVFTQGAPIESVRGSELLDRSTCKPCRDNDGKVYDSIEAGERDYPRGYYRSCKGRSRCRGFLVVNFEGSETA